MIVRTLGRTNYKVSTLGLGMYQLTGQYGVAPDVADKSIDYAIEHGINCIDVAQSYGFGEAEAIVGRAFLRHPRYKLYVCDKIGHMNDLISRSMGDLAYVSPHEILRTIKHSLWVMRQNYFDILMIHEAECLQWGFDYASGDSVVMSVLEELKKQGVVQFIGASSWDCSALTRLIETDRIDVVLSAGGITLLSCSIHKDLLQAASKHNVGVLVGGCLGQNNPGLVSKNYDAIEKIKRSNDIRQVVMAEKLSMLYDLADKLDVSMIQLAIRYVLSFEAIHCNLIGAREVAHIADNLKSINMGPLDGSTIEQINTIQSIGESTGTREMVRLQRENKLF